MNALLLAANIVMVPFDGYLGEVPTVEVCAFSYSPGTELAPGTRLAVTPDYAETYGAGSVINRGDGMTCSTCSVPRIEMDEDGVTTIYCDVNGYK